MRWYGGGSKTDFHFFSFTFTLLFVNLPRFSRQKRISHGILSSLLSLPNTHKYTTHLQSMKREKEREKNPSFFSLIACWNNSHSPNFSYLNLLYASSSGSRKRYFTSPSGDCPINRNKDLSAICLQTHLFPLHYCYTHIFIYEHRFCLHRDLCFPSIRKPPKFLLLSLKYIFPTVYLLVTHSFRQNLIWTILFLHHFMLCLPVTSHSPLQYPATLHSDTIVSYYQSLVFSASSYHIQAGRCEQLYTS